MSDEQALHPNESTGADGDLRRAIEAILFVSDEPLAATVIAQAIGADRRATEGLLDELARSLEQRESGLVLRQIAGGWRLATHPDVAPKVEAFVLANRHARLTKASLETLAIVAYKQPVTRHQIAAIRGVNSDGVLKSLTDRGLITEVGREDVPGRPVLYGTTPEFLERLGLPSLTALPSLAPLLDAVDEDGEEPEATPLADEDADAVEAEADAIHAAVAESLDDAGAEDDDLGDDVGAEDDDLGDDVAPAGSLGEMADLSEAGGEDAAGDEPTD